MGHRAGAGTHPPHGPAARGPLLWEYRPPRVHPILYAGLIVFSFVAVTGSLENALRTQSPMLYAVYAAPLAATLLVMMACWRSPVRIHEAGIAPGRPLLLRWWRPFLRWGDAAAVYPSSYDVTGGFVSPFASSDGKVTQMGLRLEMQGGHGETVRFPPTSYTRGAAESRGYAAGLDVVRDLFARQGRPLTRVAESFTPRQEEELAAEASRPFLPFAVIVAMFAGAAPLLAVLLWLDVPVAVALPAALALPLGTSLQSYRRGRRRAHILDRLAKAAEARRA